MKYTYHPMHMHLHAGHQGGASVESHMYNAQALGMRYIYITSHDNRTGPKKDRCDSFDFSRGELTYEDYPKKSCGWSATYGEPTYEFKDGCMLISASSDSEDYIASGYGFLSDGKRHTGSLLSDITLNFGLDFEKAGDARLVIDVRLSQRPPDHRPAHLRYVLGEISECDTPHTASLPLKAGEDGLYHLHLTSDVQLPEIENIVGGLDNALDTVAVLIEAKKGGSGVCALKSFTIDRKYGFEDVIVRQREVADKIGAKMGIKPFVTTEISAAGPHKNCFSTCVPVINYEERGYNVTQMEAIEHVKKYGGIFSYNHPLLRFKGALMTDEERKNCVISTASQLVASKAWGASMTEVGFVGGRGGFTLDEYLLLWDIVGMSGLFITGNGTSDSHKSDIGWFDGRNFATWLGVSAETEFPVPEADFLDSIKAGRAYMGDPVFLKNPVDFRCEGKPMGAIIPVTDRDNAKRTMTFTAEKVDASWSLRIIENGECVQSIQASDVIDGDGNLEVSFYVRPTSVVTLARVEMYNGDGRCVMLTNPIYLVRSSEYAGELPTERLYLQE